MSDSTTIERSPQHTVTVTDHTENVLPFALRAIERCERVCLVTLVGIDGSAPRSLGAQMAVTQSGAAAGSFTGGCLEGAVVAEAPIVQRRQSERLLWGT